MFRTFAVATALLTATTAMAQSRDPGDYGDLLRQATQGQDPVAAPVTVGRPSTPSVMTAAPRPAPKPKAARSGGEYLYDASEYADEPHRVRIVDRSGFDSAFLPADVPNTLRLAPGAIYIDVKARQLYFARSATQLRRYGIAVGKAGAAWKGDAVVGRTARWPDWRPTANIRRENRRLKAVVRGGASNPLGARALYLYKDGRDTLYRIHGTNIPSSIGKNASHGCIRMINEDVIELHSMVRAGAPVYVR